ncbi:WD40 repeat-containing protein [Nitzschia inconspicua]|uniref:WD40 repeat-containing protein n=1 Tax=Nitzschia inconspicua TaxID=303405 RepID=A0A9K3PD49_9STRA|nr:WD40 repeat-containing protein [Nitzschia inconspicua]
MNISEKVGEGIVATTLKGHQGSVLCLDVSSPSQRDDTNQLDSSNTTSLSATCSLLLSGSEDHTARLWDLREHRKRASLCVQTFGDVLSAMFAPNGGVDLSNEHIVSPFGLDCTIYLAVENSVLEYDLRHTKAPIVREATRNIGTVLQHQDEVNQISLAYGCIHHPQQQQQQSKKHSKKSRKGSKLTNNTATIGDSSLYLAACDDAGTVRFMDIKGTTTSSILYHDPNGVAVVPTCAFRPRSQSKDNMRIAAGLEVVSGGSDCKIHLWDLSRPKKPISYFTIDNLSSINSDGYTSKPQVCNPPIVHSLAWSASGQSLAAGLGNGSIGIFSVDNRRLVQTELIAEDSHNASVVSVVYSDFSQDSGERILCSAGSDGTIMFWDVGSREWRNEGWEQEETNDSQQAMGEKADIAGIFAESLSMKEERPRKGFSRTRKLFDIPHGRKLNWVTKATSPSNNKRDTIFVADTSTEITCYSIPMS